MCAKPNLFFYVATIIKSVNRESTGFRSELLQESFIMKYF